MNSNAEGGSTGMDSTKALRLIGMALRARRLEVGVDSVSGLIGSGRARLVVVTRDASPRAAARMRDFAEQNDVRFITAPFTKEELGRALGRAECAAVGTADSGFAKAIAESIN